MMLLDASSSQSLVNQIVAGITLAINEQRLRPGTKLPSIRKFAQTHKVSHFTAVEAYDRLVALGYLTAVRNAGFYVRSAPTPPPRRRCPVPATMPSTSTPTCCCRRCSSHWAWTCARASACCPSPGATMTGCNAACAP
ncbi:winged helix-turn-helix domain-containing protein [Pseudomonas qingdaonensis]|nr:winged helix-turn-helix domain-containing protein [Pseudomonas qingdaonensis]